MNEVNTLSIPEAVEKAQEIKNVHCWLQHVDNQVNICIEHLTLLTKANVFEEMSTKCEVLETLGLTQSLFLSIHRFFVQLREGTIQIHLEDSDENNAPDFLLATDEVDKYRTTLCVTYLEGILKEHKKWFSKKQVC